MAEVLAEAMRHPVQLVNGGLYVRGLLEEGPRKSLEPLVERLGGDADYQSMQQFLADSPWDPVLVVKATAERVAPAIDVEAWVLDDTGFPKDGKHSPGVKRQYSGTLGKIGNCQIGVSVHAVGVKGTVRWGGRCTCRRSGARIWRGAGRRRSPRRSSLRPSRSWGWIWRYAPPAGRSAGRRCSAMHAYGDNTELRDRLQGEGLQYVLSVSPEMTVFTGETKFTAPEPRSGPGRRSPHPAARSRCGVDRPADLPAGREAPEDGHVPRRARRHRPQIAVHVRARRAAHHWRAHDGKGRWGKTEEIPPREEWLIAEWPKGKPEPTDYWISNLPASATRGRLARLARLRWKIELDYKQLKGELGLDHYEGRSWLGWYHHTALVTAAHGFLTLERQHPNHQRPA